MSYKYYLTVYVNKIQKRRFLGNDKAELVERFEKWFIKQSYDRYDIETFIGEVQHAGY